MKKSVRTCVRERPSLGRISFRANEKTPKCSYDDRPRGRTTERRTRTYWTHPHSARAAGASRAVPRDARSRRRPDGPQGAVGVTSFRGDESAKPACADEGLLRGGAHERRVEEMRVLARGGDEGLGRAPAPRG
eukprot:30087-Pelagococcus_subviridis.AAC.36